jgi:hypothetical protein
MKTCLRLFASTVLAVAIGGLAHADGSGSSFAYTTSSVNYTGPDVTWSTYTTFSFDNSEYGNWGYYNVALSTD